MSLRYPHLMLVVLITLVLMSPAGGGPAAPLRAGAAGPEVFASGLGQVFGLAFDASGTLFAVGTEGDRAVLWAIDRDGAKTRFAEIADPPDVLSALGVSDHSRRLASVAVDAGGTVWITSLLHGAAFAVGPEGSVRKIYLNDTMSIPVTPRAPYYSQGVTYDPAAARLYIVTSGPKARFDMTYVYHVRTLTPVPGPGLPPEVTTIRDTGGNKINVIADRGTSLDIPTNGLLKGPDAPLLVIGRDGLYQETAALELVPRDGAPPGMSLWGGAVDGEGNTYLAANVKDYSPGGAVAPSGLALKLGADRKAPGIKPVDKAVVLRGLVLKLDAGGKPVTLLDSVAEPLGLAYRNGSLYIADWATGSIYKVAVGPVGPEPTAPPTLAPPPTPSPSAAAATARPPAAATATAPPPAATPTLALPATAAPAASQGPEAGARALFEALQKRDLERAVSATSDLTLWVLGLSREEYRRRLEILDARGYRVFSSEVLGSRFTGPDDAVVQVRSIARADEMSQPQTVVEDLALHRENGVWRMGPAGLVDYQALDVAPQTVNGVTVQPQRLIRFKDYFQVSYRLVNNSDRALLWGYGGEKPGACQFDGQLVEAAPFPTTAQIAPRLMASSVNVLLPGAQSTYPASCDALSVRWADPNSASAADLNSGPWSYHFDLTPAAQPAQAPQASGAAPLTLAGHSAMVLGLAVSPDGKTIATGSGDQTARLWDARTGQLVRTLAGPAGAVVAVAFSPDGRTLASGGEAGEVTLWDVASGQPLRSLPGNTGGTVSLAFSPDGATLASGGMDSIVRLWDPATGRALRELSGHSQILSHVTFSPDGRLLASSSRDGTIRLWDPADGRTLHTLPAHNAGALSVSFAPDGKTLASAGGDKRVKIWDAATGQQIRAFDGKATGLGLPFSPDGKMLATAGDDKVVRLWDAVTGEDLHTFSGHQDLVYNLAFFPDGKRLVSVSGDGTGKVWTLP